MRIALVCERPLAADDPVTSHVLELCSALTREGHDARMLAAPRGGRGATVRALRAEGVEVVQAHVAAGTPFTYALARSAASAGIPVVLTLHALPLHSAAVLTATDILLQWSRAMVLSAVDSVIAARIAEWRPDVSVGILPRGVDAAFWRAGSTQRPGGPVRFITAHSPHDAAGMRATISAFADAVRFLAGTPEVELQVIGARSGAAELLRLAGDRGIAARVTCTDCAGAEERREAYRRADVYLHAGDQRALLEAFASGLPVVARLDGPARDVVVPTTNGLLARNQPDLVRHISRLALEEPLRRFIGNRNRTAAFAFDWPGVVAMHRALYDAAVVRADKPLADTQA